MQQQPVADMAQGDGGGYRGGGRPGARGGAPRAPLVAPTALRSRVARVVQVVTSSRAGGDQQTAGGRDTWDEFGQEVLLQLQQFREEMAVSTREMVTATREATTLIAPG